MEILLGYHRDSGGIIQRLVAGDQPRLSPFLWNYPIDNWVKKARLLTSH